MTNEEREELIEKMVRSMWYVEPDNNALMLKDLARAALAVAEPVIREQADNALREENARLREALEPFADGVDCYTETATDEYPVDYGHFFLGHLRAAAAAIREGGKDETL